jgi:hypothetical protein
MVISPGAVSLITSTVTVSTVEVLGGSGLALFPAAFFAVLGLGLARPFLAFDLVAVLLTALPRVGLRVPLWLRAVDFLFPGVARFLRRAIIVILD